MGPLPPLVKLTQKGEKSIIVTCNSLQMFSSSWTKTLVNVALDQMSWSELPFLADLVPNWLAGLV